MRARSSSVSLPHCCLALPANSFQLPSTRSQFISSSMIARMPVGAKPGAGVTGDLIDRSAQQSRGESPKKKILSSLLAGQDLKQACTGEGLAGQSQACGRTFPCLPNVSPSHRFQRFQKKSEKPAPLSGTSRCLKEKRLAYNGLHHFGDEWLGDQEGRFR